MQILEDRSAQAIVPRDEAEARFCDENATLAKQTTWLSGCQNWYLEGTANFPFWSRHPTAFAELMEKGPRVEDYRLLFLTGPHRGDSVAPRGSRASASATSSGRSEGIVQRVTVAGHSLEYRHITAGSPESPTLVFLHESLGSISHWRDFPRRLAAACGCNALVYSRYGNGFSDTLTEARRPDYMHREALDALPQLLTHLSIDRPILFGHSDGASIAIIHEGLGPRTAAGVILCAPHVFVEDVTIRGIRASKVAYESTDLRSRLARHHADVDRTFRGWNDIWLHNDFLSWNIEECLPEIQCPVLAIQGIDDEYGTFEQIDRIAARAADVEVCKLADCRHSPHRDQPDAVVEATVRFVQRL
jgi:pimeloyl-ACP methyl ester carboxylesterase